MARGGGRAPRFELLRFAVVGVAADAVLLELEGRWSPDAPTPGRARLLREADRVPREVAPVSEAVTGRLWRATFAVSREWLAPAEAADAASAPLGIAAHGLVVDLPAPDSPPPADERHARLAREANALRRRLEQVEPQAARVAALETERDALRSDLDAAAADAERDRDSARAERERLEARALEAEGRTAAVAEERETILAAVREEERRTHEGRLEELRSEHEAERERLSEQLAQAEHAAAAAREDATQEAAAHAELAARLEEAERSLAEGEPEPYSEPREARAGGAEAAAAGAAELDEAEEADEAARFHEEPPFHLRRRGARRAAPAAGETPTRPWLQGADGDADDDEDTFDHEPIEVVRRTGGHGSVRADEPAAGDTARYIVVGVLAALLLVVALILAGAFG